MIQKRKPKIKMELQKRVKRWKRRNLNPSILVSIQCRLRYHSKHCEPRQEGYATGCFNEYSFFKNDNILTNYNMIYLETIKSFRTGCSQVLKTGNRIKLGNFIERDWKILKKSWNMKSEKRSGLSINQTKPQSGLGLRALAVTFPKVKRGIIFNKTRNFS